MQELQTLKQSLDHDRPVPWDLLPDIGLYRDQLLSYMPRQQVIPSQAEALTGAMVNNYIKAGVLPRADGKKYSRTHLSLLTAICALKQVLSVSELQALFTQLGLATPDPHQIYDMYCSMLDEACHHAAQSLPEVQDQQVLAHLALQLAVSSYVQKLVCTQLLAGFAQQDEQE